MADTAAVQEPTPQQAAETMRSKGFLALLVVVSVVGVLVSLAAWGFLELVFQIQRELYTHLPHALGYEHGPPTWWPFPILAIAGVCVALAITLLPGEGGHLPARGLAAGGPPRPIELPSVLLAGIASIGFGVVIGPEAPLIALGAGLSVLVLQLSRRDLPPRLLTLVAAAGSFAAVSFIFESPLIAAVLMIEISGLGGPRLRLLLVPGLLAAGIGTLVSIGIGSFTGLSTSAYALAALPLPHFGHPDIAQFGWSILLGVVVAIVTRFVMRGGLMTHRVVGGRELLLLPLVGLLIAGLAVGFSQATGKSVNEVLFSGQDALPGLVSSAGTWSISALILLLLFKGVAYSLSLGSFRGGPTFPALFLGTAGGLLASHLPGFSLVPAVAVGMGAGMVSVLRLPLSSVVVATVLTTKAGAGAEPLIIVGVVVAYLVSLADDATSKPEGDQTATRAAPAHPASAP